MSRVLKKDSRYPTALDTASHHTLRPGLDLHYAIVRHADNGLQLLHAPLGLGEEALVLFSSWEAVRGYYSSRRRFLSGIFGEGWYERECSAGELVSLLLRPYEGIEWVLFNPSPGVRFLAGNTQADLMSRERFMHRLLDQNLCRRSPNAIETRRGLDTAEPPSGIFGPRK